MIFGTWPRARDKTRDDIQHNLQSDAAFMQPFFKHHLALIDSNRKRDYLFFSIIYLLPLKQIARKMDLADRE